MAMGELRGELYPEEALYLDDSEQVKFQLSQGADPNFLREVDNDLKQPPLIFAIYKKHKEVIEIVKALLDDPRTDVNAKNAGGETALIICSYYSLKDEIAAEVASLLLKHPKIDVNQRDNYGVTAVYAASFKGKVEVLRVLVADERVDPNVTLKSDGYSPLFRAAELNRLDCVKILLSSPKIDPNVLTHGETPMQIAHENQHKTIVTELLKHPSAL